MTKIHFVKLIKGHLSINEIGDKSKRQKEKKKVKDKRLERIKGQRDKRSEK